MKIAVRTNGQEILAKVVQEHAFDLGYQWDCGKQNTVKYVDSDYFIFNEKNKNITYIPTDHGLSEVYNQMPIEDFLAISNKEQFKFGCQTLTINKEKNLINCSDGSSYNLENLSIQEIINALKTSEISIGSHNFIITPQLSINGSNIDRKAIDAILEYLERN